MSTLVRLSVFVSNHTFKQLETAAAELDLPTHRHAALCLEAAMRLWAIAPDTSSVPAAGNEIAIGWGTRIWLDVAWDTLARLGHVATVLRIDPDTLLYAVIERAFIGHEEAHREIEPPEPIKPPRPQMPKREPFDPKRYAFSPANTRALDAELSRRAIAATERRQPVKRGMP